MSMTRAAVTPRLVFVLLSILVAGYAFGADNKEVVTFDPDKTAVEFTLSATLHSVHGTFKLKSGIISFDPATGAASGALIVDASSGDSGNKSRDAKMNREVLESDKYSEIVFVPQAISGNVLPQGQSRVTVNGVLRLHGLEHPLTLEVPLFLEAGRIRVTTQFQVPYQAWGLKNPSTLLLHVGSTVQIDIAASGTLRAEQAASQ
jgi:polyisoprenoid-binding protein YceI